MNTRPLSWQEEVCRELGLKAGHYNIHGGPEGEHADKQQTLNPMQTLETTVVHFGRQLAPFRAHGLQAATAPTVWPR